MIRRRVMPCSALCAVLLAGSISTASAQTALLSRGALGSLPTPEPVAAVQAPGGRTPDPAFGSGDAASMPGVARLLTSLGDDLGRLARPENGLLIGIGSAAAFAASRVDDDIEDAVWGRGLLHEVLEPGEIVGGFYAQTGGAFATYAIGRLTGNERVAQVGSELVRAQVLTQVTTQFIKLSTQRSRPDGTPLSFPSGHSGGSFATAAVLQRNFGWKAGVPAYAVAAWVAASRVQMKRHHLSDVIAGATVGILAGRAVTIGKGDNTFAVTPTYVPGGAGVSFTRISR